MSYETVIDQVKMLPEPLLASVSAFIKLLEAEQGRGVTENYTKQAKPKDKQAFFALAGNIHLDSDAVTELREASLI